MALTAPAQTWAWIPVPKTLSWLSPQTEHKGLHQPIEAEGAA